MEISASEVMRYLGGSTDGQRISALVKDLTAEITSHSAPKNVYGIWDCDVDSLSVKIAGIIINSENLAGHLRGCYRAVLLAATLGTEADTLIRRYSIQDMEKAVIAQAVCTAMIEAYCDWAEGEIAKTRELAGLCGTRRYSPGYGDFDIGWQKEFVNLLNCDRRIGLALTSGYMLVPSKSITAIIGYSEEKKYNGNKCSDCGSEQCGFREKE